MDKLAFIYINRRAIQLAKEGKRPTKQYNEHDWWHGAPELAIELQQALTTDNDNELHHDAEEDDWEDIEPMEDHLHTSSAPV